LPGLVEADDLGTYVVKFRGAGQGLKALVAEVIAGELGRHLGLRVPVLVALTLDAVIDKFLARQKERLRPRTFLEVQRHLSVYWKPLHRVHVGSINRAMVASRLSEIEMQRNPTVADHARS